MQKEAYYNNVVVGFFKLRQSMISVVMPVCNTNSLWLKETVDSILNQTFKKIEVIIVDNGSNSKDTKSLLSYFHKNNNIKVIHLKHNFGISFGCNKGIQESQFDLIARMDADDFSLPKRLFKQFDYLQRNPNVDLVGSNLTFMVANNKRWILKNKTDHPHIITKKIASSSLWFINHPTVLFKKKSVLDVGGYDESPNCIVEDYELWIRMLQNDKILHNMPESLLYYRQHDKSYTKSFRVNQKLWQIQIQKKLFEYTDFKQYKRITIL